MSSIIDSWDKVLKALPRALSHRGWILAAGGFLAIGMIWYASVIVLTQATGQPVPGFQQDTIKVAPASGVNSFAADNFCADPLTTVREFEAPDASGTTYQLTRVKDGKTETVTAVFDTNKAILMAKHYYDTNSGQDSEGAIVNQAARDCITKKAK